MTSQRRPYQPFALADDIPLANRILFVQRLTGLITRKQAEGGEPISLEQQAELDRLTAIDMIQKMLSFVTDDRGRTLLIARFGLDGHIMMRTLKQCTEPFNLTRERIRQIESRSLAEIRMRGRHLFEK